MMDHSKADDTPLQPPAGPIDLAAAYWARGKAYDAGELIFDSLPVAARATWAVGTLKAALEWTGFDRTDFEEAIRTAEHPRMWANGHRAFDRLRRKALELGERGKTVGLSQAEKVYRKALGLAELVAKVTYNAVDPPDPFDEDSGPSIAVALRNLIDTIGDPALVAAGWSVLSKPPSKVPPIN
jgi:hypothetical protein